MTAKSIKNKWQPTLIQLAKAVGIQLGSILALFPRSIKASVISIFQTIVRKMPPRLDTLVFCVFHEGVKKAFENAEGNLIFTKKAFGNFLINLDVVRPSQGGIYLRKVYEPHISFYLKRNVREGDCFLDAGAHVGYYALLAARLVGPRGVVVAFEPDPENFKALVANVNLNRFRNVLCAQKALSNEVSVRTFNVNPFNEGGGSLETLWDGRHYCDDYGKMWSQAQIKEKSAHRALQHEVETAILEDLMPSLLNKERRLRFAKIDVEGHELKVLQGMRRLMEAGQPEEIICEVSKNHREVFSLLNSHGYIPYTLDRYGNAKAWKDQPVTSDFLFLKRN